jgi:uncharacterized repeat protein (TIGR01451 family)
MSRTEPDRPSRQSLVVPQRQSHMPVVLGALACGCAGFGMVWAFGGGRASVRPPDVVPAVEVNGKVTDSTPDASNNSADRTTFNREPGRLQLPEEGIRAAAPADRWRPRGPEGLAAETQDASVGDRYAARPASLELPESVIPVSGESQPSSRFADADIPPVEPAAPADSAPMPAVQEPDAGAEPALPAGEDVGNGEADASFPPAGLTPPPEPPAAPATPAEPQASNDVAAAQPGVPEDAGDLPPPPAVVPPPAPPAYVPPFAASSPPAAIADHPAARPAVAPPRVVQQPQVQAATVSSPYAAAPPIVSGNDSDAFPGGLPAGPHGRQDAAGQGRPGPLQLEGVQMPQLSVEKRGPREVQVGKPARYEIFVRNVGSATAREVTLRDAVPFGTALITTAPPASPVTNSSGSAPGGELVWSLGTLDPGSQARVVMEVMPQQEGEIGSVASVSFRADASVRSRATKPDLKIEATEPKAVLIGRDMQLTIKVTNPGTGVATGVVLEGFLPENVSHRAGKELEFDVGQLRPGESRTIDLVLGTRGPGVHPARFSARADGGIEVEQPVKLEVTAPTLELSVDMPLRRFLQRPATCTISMINAGTAPARAIELAAQLPPGMKFVRANNAGWHDDRTHRVHWNLEELPPGETGTVEVVVMPIDLGSQKIMAAARSADGLADQVAHTCEVEGLAALFFDVADSEDPVEVDGQTEYVVRVRNQGTKPATGVRVTASLLGDLEPVEAQGPVGHRLENLTVVFEPLAKLAPSEESVFRVRARGRRAGDQRVQVQVVSEDHPTPITKEEITRVYADR